MDPDRLRERLGLAAGAAGTPGEGSASYELEDDIGSLAESAIDEALALGHRYVGSEHLLLAVTRVTSRVAVAELAQAGVDHENARRELARLFRECPPALSSPARCR